MDFATIRPALKALIESLTSDDPAARVPTVWRDQQQPFGSAFVKLHLGPVRAVGTDELRTEYVEPREPGTNGEDDPGDPGDELEDTLCGVRIMTLNLLAETTEQRDGRTAWTILEDVRKRLYRRGTGEALRAVGLSLLDSSPTLDLSLSIDSRQASRAALDLRLNVAFSEKDPARYPYVDKVRAGGTLTEGDKDSEIAEFEIDGSTAP